MNWHPARAPRAVVDLILRPLERFLRIEAASGVLLLLAAATALFMANSPWAPSFGALWSTPLTLGVGSLVSKETVRFWINDGLMTLFFLVVGLEIKRELRDGVLSELRAAALPIAAALGGVVAPAAVYLALNSAPELRQGWAIPTATDIAFAVGVLSLLGSRVPPALRALLLTLAIVDDMVAVAVIAGYYAAGVEAAGLLVAAAGLLAMFALRRLGSHHSLAFLMPGVMIWMGLEHSGIHPAIAGVIVGLLIPSESRAEGGHAAWNEPLRPMRGAVTERRSSPRGRERASRDLPPSPGHLRLARREVGPPAARIEAALHPWVAYGVIPLFALANAGVALSSTAPDATHAPTLAAGIVLALAVGKPLGILLAVWLCVTAGLSVLPAGITWRHVLVLGCLGGIGFTMSIFISNLAFTAPSLLAIAKLSVLAASALSACTGLWLGRSLPRTEG